LDTRTVATHPFTVDTLNDGDIVYLSPTNAGYITNVKPYAPNHLVYIGKVIRTSPTNGYIEYQITNGFELNELHDVVAQTTSYGDILSRGVVSGKDVWVSTKTLNGSYVISGTVSASTYNITTTPTNNNSNTQVLTRNSTTGNIEYRSASTLGGATVAFSPMNVSNCELAPTAASTQYYYQTVAEVTMTLSKVKIWGYSGTDTVLFGVYRGKLQGSMTLLGQGSVTAVVGPNVITLTAQPGQTLDITAGEDLVIGYYADGTSWRTLYDNGISDINFGILNTTNIATMPASPTGPATNIRFACTLY